MLTRSHLSFVVCVPNFDSYYGEMLVFICFPPFVSLCSLVSFYVEMLFLNQLERGIVDAARLISLDPV